LSSRTAQPAVVEDLDTARFVRDAIAGGRPVGTLNARTAVVSRRGVAPWCRWT